MHTGATNCDGDDVLYGTTYEWFKTPCRVSRRCVLSHHVPQWNYSSSQPNMFSPPSSDGPEMQDFICQCYKPRSQEGCSRSAFSHCWAVGKWLGNKAERKSIRLPGWHSLGQGVHSLKAVTVQSVLHGRRQGRTVSGRMDSGHLSMWRDLINACWSK